VPAERATLRGLSGLFGFYRTWARSGTSWLTRSTGVYKVNRLDYQQTLVSCRARRGSRVAHKYPARRRLTEIIDIEVQVGDRSIDPVARLKPVSVGGVTVTNATLHNETKCAERMSGEGRRRSATGGDVIRKW